MTSSRSPRPVPNGGSAAARKPVKRADRGAPPGGPATRSAGIVKWFDPAKGFGFIAPADSDTDIFVHISALRRSGLETISPGQKVRMMVQDGLRGREAATVEII